MSLKTLLTISFCAAAGMALAHAGATGVVKERMDGMKTMGQALKALVETTKSGENDAAILLKAAHLIESEAGENMLRRFPEGHLPDVSEASPEIWTNWAEFKALAEALERSAQALQQLESNTGAVPAQIVSDISGTCRDCHKAFRIKK